MSRLVSRAESWERVYEAFENINFTAFDYNSVKQSILEYVKLYFPETFNDFIESSEFIAILESFAYICELMAYRIDTAAHENFLSTAQRRDSVLRLAKLVSYTASRPLPARGLVKLTSVSTTETLLDTNGTDLAGVNIRWNDSSNTNWKDQFILVMNRVLQQGFGSVGPNDRFQIQDVLFELYGITASTLELGVFKYTATANGRALPMELVPVEHSSSLGIIERRPEVGSTFNILYGSDGLGNGSETTGFFCLTKQGSLQRFTQTFDGITPNQTYDIPASDVNDIDVWVNNVNPSTGLTLDNPSPLLFRPSWTGRSGDWIPVDLGHAQNIIFNTNPNRNKYEIETRDNNQVRLIFGDGEFADVPGGTFHIWVRTSVDDDIVIPQTSVIDSTSSFAYVDSLGRTQTFTFTFSLIGSLQNGSAAETIEHIRTTAPSVYYAQDRMVNGQDYNTFLLQDPSILKLRATNRTFAGDSKYIPWHDASSSYENVKLFGDDGILYFQEREISSDTPVIDLSTLITSYLEPLLASTDIFLQLVVAGVPVSKIRREFNVSEKSRITTSLTPPPLPARCELYFNKLLYEWFAIKENDTPSVALRFGYQSISLPSAIVPVSSVSWSGVRSFNVQVDGGGIQTITVNGGVVSTYAQLITEISTGLTGATASIVNGQIRITSLTSGLTSSVIITDVNLISTIGGTLGASTDMWTTDFIQTPLLRVDQINVLETKYTVFRLSRRIVFESQTTRFWNTNSGNKVIEYDTLSSTSDEISILKANVNHSRTGTLTQNWSYNVLGLEQIDTGPELGLEDIHRLSVLSVDDNNDRVPDFVDPNDLQHRGIADIINVKLSHNIQPDAGGVIGVGNPDLVTLPISYIAGSGDITISPAIPFVEVNSAGATILPGTISNTIKFQTNQNANVTILVNDYVYFTRPTISDAWVPMETSIESINSYVLDQLATTQLWKRHNGRDGLNFLWMHRSPRYYLVDPSPTNIIDMFIITKGYYLFLKRWLEDSLAVQPDLPTPLDLRTSYGYLLDNKMISDTVILHPGKIKLLFGAKAASTLQAKFKIVRSQNGILTDNQVKTQVVTSIRNFFDISSWEFGETFWFTELSAAIHAALPTEISSVVLVPLAAVNQFGNLFQVLAREDEVFYPDITVDNIEIVSGFTTTNLRLNG